MAPATVTTTKLLRGADGKDLRHRHRAPAATEPTPQLLDSHDPHRRPLGPDRVSVCRTRWARWGRGRTPTVAGPVGRPASRINSSAAGLVLDGTLKGGVTVGSVARRRSAPRGASADASARWGRERPQQFVDPSAAHRPRAPSQQQRRSDTLGSGLHDDHRRADRQEQIDTVQAGRIGQLYGSCNADGRRASSRTPSARVELNVDGRITSCPSRRHAWLPASAVR